MLSRPLSLRVWLTSGRPAATNGRGRVGARRGLAHNRGVNKFRHATPHSRAIAGFTLIEIMIVAVVLANIVAFFLMRMIGKNLER